jgi:hypothetical protein
VVRFAYYGEIGFANKKYPVAHFVQTCPAAWKPGSSGSRAMNDEASLLFITPTYPRRQRMRFLRRCAHDFRSVHNLFWIVIEDGDQTSPEVGQLLAQSGIPHIYAAHGPTRRWGNAQRNWGLKYIRDERLQGVVYLADDDNKYDAPLFDELRAPIGEIASTPSIWPGLRSSPSYCTRKSAIFGNGTVVAARPN